MKAHLPIEAYLLYLGSNLIKQGEEEGVKVSQEKGKDSSQLPLEGDTRVIILQFCDGFKQRRTHQPQQRHHKLHLRHRTSESVTNLIFRPHFQA